MMRCRLYRYRALRPSGAIAVGIAFAADAEQLREMLHEIRHEECLAAYAVPLRGWWQQRAHAREITQFCFRNWQLLSAGLPLLAALEEHEIGQVPDFTAALSIFLVYRLKHGQLLSQALAALPDWFSASFRGLIAASEQTGNLAETFEQLYQERLWQEDFQRELYRGLLGPLLSLLMVIACGIFLFLELSPALKQFAAHIGQPTTTHQFPWPIDARTLQLSGGGLLVALLVYAYQQRAHRLLKLPWIGRLLRQWELANFCRTLSSLYDAGLPILTALSYSIDTVNTPALQAALRNAQGRIEQGQSLSTAFAADPAFPPLLSRMLVLGEESGRLGLSLSRLASQWIQDVRFQFQQAKAALVPGITLLTGVLLTTLILTLIAPVYSMLGSIK